MAILVFTLDVDGRPTLTFEAGSTRAARELCNEEWLRGDLSARRSNGSPLWAPIRSLAKARDR